MPVNAAPFAGPDGVPRRTHPLTLATAVVPLVTAAIFFTAISALGSTSAPRRGSAPPFGLWFFVGMTALTGVAQLLKWFTTTYTVLPTELVIDEGVLSREHRVLPYARVQQADTHQNLVGQMLGLTEVRVDCAGAAGATQIKLRLLDANTALALRDYVLQRRAELQHRPAPTDGGVDQIIGPAGGVRGYDVGGAPVGPDGLPLMGIAPATGLVGAFTPAETFAVHEVPVLALGPGRLAVGALTHSSLVIGIPVLFFGGLWSFAISTVAAKGSSGGATVGLLAAVPLSALFVGLIALRLFVVVVGQYGFQVALAGDDIHLRYGLLETRNLTVPRRRVQQITIADNPLRRALGFVELHLHTAAAPGAGEGKAGTTKFSIPIVRRSELDALVTTLMGDHTWAVPAITQRNGAARRRGIVRRCLVLAVVVGGPAVLLRPLGLVLLVLSLVGVPWGLIAHRRAGHGLSITVVALTHGALHHRIDLVPVNRVQSCRTYRSPLQRMNGLSTLIIDVAGSAFPPFLWDMTEPSAIDLRRSLPRQGAA